MTTQSWYDSMGSATNNDYTLKLAEHEDKHVAALLTVAEAINRFTMHFGDTLGHEMFLTFKKLEEERGDK